MSKQKIPFVDLKGQYHSIKEEIDKAIEAVIEQTSFIGGPYVQSFEQQFAEKCGVRQCIGVANGTDAIYIVLKMLGIKAGDEVITVANTWISTAETVSQTGATPVFIDTDPYFTIDADKIKARITRRTKAIIPVHLYGQPCDMDALMKICDDYGLYLVEDCAQAHFSRYKNRLTGTFGVASTFSFYPGKNLGAYGDAGAIVTNDEDLAQRMRMYANHGALKKHEHAMEGINSRLDSLQANILQVKLKYILQWNSLRNKHANMYDQLLSSVEEIEIPQVRRDCSHSYHLYVIKAPRRDQLKQFLAQNGIETSIHYPTILPLLSCYGHLNHKPEDFPNAFRNQKEILSLPMFPELSQEQISKVSESIKKFYHTNT